MSNKKPIKIKDTRFLLLITEMAIDIQNVLRELIDRNQDAPQLFVSDEAKNAIVLLQDLINISETKKISLVEATKIHWFAMQYISDTELNLENNDELLKCVYVRTWIEKHFEINHEDFPSMIWEETK